MRRIVLLASLFALSACSGFGGFVGDTLTVNFNPNRPRVDSDNMRRAMGQTVDVMPLLPEPGNVWPGPPQPEPTLEDIERQQNGTTPNGAPPPRGSSTPPGSYQPVAPIGQVPPPASPPNTTPPPYRPPSSGTVQTPRGPAVTTTGGNGVQQYLAPNGSSGTVINNGNGTVTTIAPDGTVSTVPAPK